MLLQPEWLEEHPFFDTAIITSDSIDLWSRSHYSNIGLLKKQQAASVVDQDKSSEDF